MLKVMVTAAIISSPLVRMNGSRPNILHIVLDDFGWADAGWHRDNNYTDIQTPVMDSLVKTGIELDRHYSFQYCSPSRCAIQTGRNPIHVNVLNLSPTWTNKNDPMSGYTGIPRNMTSIADVLKQANYTTHIYGKWNAGMATHDHTPAGRGYDHSVVYFHEKNDYWNTTAGVCDGMRTIVDLWQDDHTGEGLNNSQNCSQENQSPGCVHEDALFTKLVEKAILNSSADAPFYIHWSPHVAHQPLEVPDYYLQRFKNINDTTRRAYHALVYYIDEAVGNVTAALISEKLWDDTLVIVHSDNGGPIYIDGGGNNYPLKGGKMSSWEGGIRVPAFVSGGLLEPSRAGLKLQGYVASWDWYATLAYLAGVDPEDERAKKAGLPPIDSINVWPYISGQTTISQRTQIPLGGVSYNSDGPFTQQDTEVLGLIKGDYKILVGTFSQAGWTGPIYPNSSTVWDPSKTTHHCGGISATGCLFNIINDPSERNNIAKEQQGLFKQMHDTMKEIEKSLFSPNRGRSSPDACKVAIETHGGFWGPFVE